MLLNYKETKYTRKRNPGVFKNVKLYIPQIFSCNMFRMNIFFKNLYLGAIKLKI